MREFRESMGCDQNRFLKRARDCGSSEHLHGPVRRQIGREGGRVGAVPTRPPGLTQPLNMAEFRDHRCLASCNNSR